MVQSRWVNKCRKGIIETADKFEELGEGGSKLPKSAHPHQSLANSAQAKGRTLHSDI